MSDRICPYCMDGIDDSELHEETDEDIDMETGKPITRYIYICSICGYTEDQNGSPLE